MSAKAERITIARYAAVLSLAAVVAMTSTALTRPVPAASAAVTAEDCAAALGYPDRTAEQRAWLQLCVDSLRPNTPPPSPTPSATAEPSASAAPSPSASPTPPAPPVETATYTVDGRFLKDPRGATVVVRGVEQVMWSASWLPNSHITQIGLSGANTVRILPYFTKTTPTGDPRNTLAQIEDQIKRGINAKMMVDVAIDGGTLTSTWLRADVKALMFKYRKNIVIHAKGESYESSGAAWVTASNSVVAQLRAAGYDMPLYIMSRIGGRDLTTLLRYGPQVQAADPLHRIVFGWQAYWSPNTYQNSQACPLVSSPWPASATPPCSLSQAFAAVANAAVPIQVGLIKHADQQDGNPAVMDWSALLTDADNRGLGWLWWDWRMGVDDLTTDGQYGHWAHDGAAIVVNHPDSIKNTAVRTPFQLAQTA